MDKESKSALLVNRLKAHLRQAMKERDTVVVMTLRTMLATLDNATAVEVDTSQVPLVGLTPDVPRRELSEAQQHELLVSEAQQRRAAMQLYEEMGQQAEAQRLRRELKVFDLYVDSSLGDNGQA